MVIKSNDPPEHDLIRLMQDAADRGDFELAARVRDRISILRGAGPDASKQDVDPTGLSRQQPGQMGLGTNRQEVSPPPGWVRPKKPDPMTTGTPKHRKPRSY